MGGAIPIGRLWGIEIKVHIIFVLLIGFELLQAGAQLPQRAIFLLVLFGSVFLHELGHCAGARLMGGDAKEIVLWPLGGLARLHTPPLAKAEFVSTAAGPLVNLLLFFAALGVTLATYGLEGLGDAGPRTTTLLTLLVLRGVEVNLLLFLFNIIPAYPMDGGRILRSILWAVPGIGWRTATIVATVTALVFGGLFVASAVLLRGLFDPIILALIGVMVLMSSYQELRRALAHRSLPRLDDDRMPHERP